MGDADQDEQSRFLDRPDHLAVHGDRRGADSLYYGSHDNILAYRRSSGEQCCGQANIRFEMRSGRIHPWRRL
ncbi:hypothetical protein GCM10010522_57200 [Kribbella solani]